MVHSIISTLVVVLCLFNIARASEAPDVEQIEEPVIFNPKRPGPCGARCNFRMCNFNGTRFEQDQAAFVFLNAPKSATLPYICNRMENIGLVLKTGEASVAVDDGYVPVSKWTPTGLRKNFKKNVIRTYKVPYLPHSGIGRLSTTVNQWSFLHDQCMIMPIQKYQSIDLDTGRPKEIIEKDGENDCVAFRTTAPAIQIELSWDTADDFDLQVTEPDGDVLSHKNTRTEYGKLNQDNNVGFCETSLLFGRENVLYFPNPNIEVGKYKVRVVHFKKCGTKPSNWLMKIVVNGVVRLERSQYSAAGGNTNVGGASFTWP